LSYADGEKQVHNLTALSIVKVNGIKFNDICVCVCVVELVDFCGHVLCKQHLIYIYKVKFIRFNFGTGHIFLTQMMY